MQNKNRRITSQEFEKCQIGKYTKGDFDIEKIGKIKEIAGGIELFAKAWKNGKAIGFGDGSVEIERFKIFGLSILTENEKDKTEDIKVIHTPAETLKISLAHTISLIGKIGAKIIKGKIGKTTATFYPGQSSDDGYEIGETPHTINLTNYAIATGIDAYYWGAVRFPAINIPQGATISSASLRITNSGYCEGATALKIYAEAIDDAPTLNGSDVTNITDRTKTTNYGTVNLPTGASWGTVANCTDLASTISEIIGRGGWSSGNDLMLLLYPNGSNEWGVISYDGEGSSYHMKLDITYTIPAVGKSFAQII